MDTKMLRAFSWLYMVSTVCVFGLTKQKVTSFKDCDVPESKYDLENFINHTFSLVTKFGKTFLSFNFTINKETPSVTYHLRGFGIQKSVKRIDFDIKNLSCRHPVTTTILKKLMIPYEPSNCTGKPGQYLVPRLNMDDFSRFYYYTARGYNQYTIEVELTSPKGVLICLAITIEISVK